MAAHYGHKVRRYLSCPVEGCDGEARRLAANQPWVRDGLMQAVRLLSRMKQYHVTLAELLGRLPDFAVTTRTIPCEGNPGRILRQLRDETPEAASDGAPAEGARVRLRGGTGLVRPTKAGKNLVLVAEASSAEIAEEVCGRLDVARGIAIYDQLLPGKNKTPGVGRIKGRRAGRAAAGDRTASC